MSSKKTLGHYLFQLGYVVLLVVNIFLLIWSITNFLVCHTPIWPWLFVWITCFVTLAFLDNRRPFRQGEMVLVTTVFCVLALFASGSTITSSWGYDGTWVKDGQTTKEGKTLFGLHLIDPVIYVATEETFSAPNIFVDIDPVKFSYGKYRFSFTGTIKQLPNVSNEQILAAAAAEKNGYLDSFIAEKLLPEMETIFAEAGLDGVLRLRAVSIDASFQPPENSQLVIALAKLGYTCNRVGIRFKLKD